MGFQTHGQWPLGDFFFPDDIPQVPHDLVATPDPHMLDGVPSHGEEEDVGVGFALLLLGFQLGLQVLLEYLGAWCVRLL